MPRTDISNSDDVIDSRQVIERIEELTAERAELYEASTEGVTTAHSLQLQNAVTEWDAENGAELAALLALQEEAEGYVSDWRYGATLIRDSYFTEYAQELADDIGAVKDDAGWPNRHIDWEAATKELKQDYTQVDFDGVAYWIR